MWDSVEDVYTTIFWFVSLSVCLSELARANVQQFTVVDKSRLLALLITLISVIFEKGFTHEK